MRERNVYHRQIAVAAPWANGLVERVNRFLKSSLRKVVEDQTSWADHLDIIQYVINNTYHSSIKSSPSKLLLGYEQRCHADQKLVEVLNNIAKVETDLCSERDSSREIALEITDKLRNYNKIYYDKRHKTPSKYKAGDYVLIRDTTVKPGEDKI